MVLALKVPLKDAQKWKDYLVKNGLFDPLHSLTKDQTHICYPIKSKFKILKGDAQFIETALEQRDVTRSLKESLRNEFSKKELDQLKTAHDIVGDIAILEIPKELVKKEKLIAKKLLSMNPNIKTVLKKSSSHSGEFRTQKMKYLAGEKKKETLHKENNVAIKVDVEKVYFSTRLGNERKRISEMIKPGEDVLVMFSGCAPYPIVFSKNTDACSITGIEINPQGHRYGIDNIYLNKAQNVTLINGDVKKVASSIMKYIVGLKSSIGDKEFKSRVAHNPSIFELMLYDNDLAENKGMIERRLKYMKSKGISAAVHAPYHLYNKKHDYKKSPRPKELKYYNLSQKDIAQEIHMLKELGELCKKHQIKAIIHLNDPRIPIDKKLLIDNMRIFEKYFDYFYFETLTSGFADYRTVIEVGKAAGIKNVCIDLSHLFIMYASTEKMVEAITAIKKEFNTYFHVADNDKITHTCELGKGLIDFKKIVPLINTGVIEVQSKDYIHSPETINSWNYLDKLSPLKKYDRIVMPLPKTADEFLDSALMLARKGTVIHFYDFLEEDKFDEAKKKIEIACKRNSIKYNILRVVRCGQQSPYVYRVCVDFEVV